MKQNVLPFPSSLSTQMRPADHLHEALANGKPEARASVAPRHGSVGLGEGLEETFLARRARCRFRCRLTANSKQASLS